MWTGAGLPAELPRPAPSGRPRPRPGILHLGPGAFFRAFVAPWIEEAVARSGGDWGIIAVSLKSATARDHMRAQDWVYTAAERAPEETRTRQIEVIREVLVAPEDPAAVLDRLADPAIRIASLTVTEKGYCHDPATGRLNRNHPDIRHDLDGPLPRSAPGFLVRGLAARRKARLPPFTVLSCDNLPDNGALTRHIVLDLAGMIDPGLADWIADQGAFPSTMVDRIVPATTDADLAAIAGLTGRHDPAAVIHEPFRQWVVEDRFAAGRPDLQAVGVEMVTDVAPYELMKLRMLNGAHSALAYLGYLAGHRHVSAAVEDPVLAAFIRNLWAREIGPTLVPPIDPGAYSKALFHRFANPAIRHSLWQIAMDGSQKLPQRILGTLSDAIAAGRPAPGLLLVVAGWMRYVGGRDESGGAIEVKDPLAARLKAIADAARSPEETVRGFLALREVFSPAIATRIAAPLTGIYAALIRDGARAAAARLSGA
ncbi:MAG: mannitol dehydrogenase family protein [Tabrizicola sp.]|nr:mannitol dehydrogenase family protein [Tabrizicola sp.]